MAQINHSTIVQLLFCEAPTLDFAALTQEMETALDLASAGHCTVTRDHDDLVLLEADGCRFVLSYADQLGTVHAACLTLSVGPAVGFQDLKLPILTEAACRMIINRLVLRYSPDAQTWQTIPGPVGQDEIDDLNANLVAQSAATVASVGAAVNAGPAAVGLEGAAARMGLNASEAVSEPEMLSEVAEIKPARSQRAPGDRFELVLLRKLHVGQAAAAAKLAGAAVVPQVQQPANDVPDLPPINQAVIRNVRDALYPEVEVPSKSLRLAAHSMDATMILVALPVGAAMLTYSLLRGGNANVSARVMAITCTILGLSQTGLTSQFVAML